MLLTTILLTVFGSLQAAADDLGYPPPPGPYRSESRIPQPAQLPAKPATANPINSGTRTSRGGAGLLPLPADTFSASDTADILFGSVPTMPPPAAEPHDPAQQTAQDSAPAYPSYQQPAASYYPAHPNQFENPYGHVPTDAYQAPYRPSPPYGMPPASAPEAAAADIFRPAEQN